MGFTMLTCCLRQDPSEGSLYVPTPFLLDESASLGYKFMITTTFVPVFEPYEDDSPLAKPQDDDQSFEKGAQLQLTAYYLSRDRVLGLLDVERLPAHVLAVLQGQDVVMSSGILSNVVGTHVLNVIRAGGIRTLTQLAFEGGLKTGMPFIYEGHVYGKGFAYANKSPLRSLSEKLDPPLAGRKLVIEFSKSGLVNDTASSRLSGSVGNIFIYGYIAEIEPESIRAVPYIIGDLVDRIDSIPLPFLQSLELRPEQIAQFAAVDSEWTPSKAEFERMRQVPEQAVKELLCRLLGEHDVPRDWGGEECDVMSGNLSIDGQRQTGAFLLKGPARFHPMRPTDLGKNGDQLYRLFNIPAQVYVVQHCHTIGAAVRKQAEAYALSRTFIAPCRFTFIDGLATARLLRAHGEWPAAIASKTKRSKG